LPAFTALPEEGNPTKSYQRTYPELENNHHTMPPSQLKRLKASLREQGVIGPQKSKKEKKQNVQNGVHKEKRVGKTEVLNSIRDQFNPFEYKWSKAPRFEATSIKNPGGKGEKGAIVGRPSARKSLDIERVRLDSSVKSSIQLTLLQFEINQLAKIENRRRVGGITDRRFGENDPTMAPEERMLERFAQEKQRRHENSIFDLEGGNEFGELTHMGQSLFLNAPAIVDDFDEDLELSDVEDHSLDEERPSRKRRRLSDNEGLEDEVIEDVDRSERKKSKQEVMKELIAKSKLHKYERQVVKEDDEELREDIDKELSSIEALLRGMGKKRHAAQGTEISGKNPDRAVLLDGADKVTIEKDYEKRLRQLGLDARAKPTERSKTEAQLAEERARLQKEREEKAQRRMQGLSESDDEESIGISTGGPAEEEENPFGLGLPARQTASQLGAEDEDEFFIDDDLVASDSDMEEFESDSLNEGAEEAEVDDGDAESFQRFLANEEAQSPNFLTGANAPLQKASIGFGQDIKCPQSHEELLETLKGLEASHLPEVIKRIRSIYQPQMNAGNTAKLGNFAVSLIDHMSYIANASLHPPFSILETVIRHIHSLAKRCAVEVSNGFRRHLNEIHASRSLSLTAGDLVLLTAIGTIFPPSDHFHQVATPALLTMARYLGLKIAQTLSDLAVGTYLCTLCLQYQKQSKRYVPEVMNFIENTLCVLAPSKLLVIPGNFPYHEPKTPLRLERALESVREFAFSDCFSQEVSVEEEVELKAALLEASLANLEVAADTWAGKAAFPEVFGPALTIVQHLAGRRCRPKISTSSQVSTGHSNSYPGY
jgi:nucleolar protein 14